MKAALMPRQLSTYMDRVRSGGRLFSSETEPSHPQQGPLLKAPSSDFSAFRLLFAMSSLMLLGIIPKTMCLEVLGFDLLDLSLHNCKCRRCLPHQAKTKRMEPQTEAPTTYKPYWHSRSSGSGGRAMSCLPTGADSC